MKKTLLLFCLLMAGITQAQIVNIPDAAFKAQLIGSGEGEFIDVALDINGNPLSIDANNDGEIQVTEALAVYESRIFADNTETISNFTGINSFSNLNYLELIGLIAVTQLDISGLVNLESLLLSDYDNVESITFNSPGLKHLHLITGNLPIDFTQFPALETIRLDQSHQTVIDVTQADNLQSFKIYGEWNVHTMNFGDKLLLTELRLETGTNFTSLDLSGCTALTHLELYYSNVFESSPAPRFLNLKNGITSYEHLQLILEAYAATPLYICVDEGNEDLLANASFFGDNYLISTYCSFTPGGSYNTISGTLNYSYNAGDCGSAALITAPLKVNLTTGAGNAAFYSNSGNYNFYAMSGTFVVTPQFENDWFIANPPSATINFADNNNNTSSHNFCVTANGVYPDVEVVLIPIGNAQPGFDASYKIVYRNKGNQALSGSVTLNYDDTVLDYASASPAEASSSTGYLTWNYSNLQPFEDREVTLVLNLNGPMETPALEIDDELLFNVAISPATGDETPADNSFAFTHIVTGAFDPNDITCLQGAFATPDKIGDYLHYNINFENTGNAAATFIVVKDVIDATQFDVNSLQLLNASHDVEVRVEGNTVEFFFDDIDLGAHEKGNVVFKVKTLNTLQVNDDVTQQANIFFDYNWPIETNEATTVFQVLGTDSFIMDESVSIYPNPATSLINIKASLAIKSVQLYDMQGRLLQALSANDLHAVMDISNRALGIYVLKVTTQAGVKAEKIFKK